MSKHNYPKYAIIKKGNYGVPYNPSSEAETYFKSDGKYIIPDPSVKEDQIIEEGHWVYVLQHRRKGESNWKDDVVDFSLREPVYPDPLDEFRTIYRLVKQN